MEIISFKSLNNTNNYLLELSKNNAKEWTVIKTEYQINGKGYGNNKWISEKGKNLTFSFLLKIKEPYQNIIYLNMWILNCICTFFKLNKINIYIKWPNDIILNDKKIGGVLIETFKKEKLIQCIIGIGLNINQTQFHIKNASSLYMETNKKYNKNLIFNDILRLLKIEYCNFNKKNFISIKYKYISSLYKLNKISKFIFKNKKIIGTIIGVNNYGELIVKINNKYIYFKHKEISLIY